MEVSGVFIFSSMWASSPCPTAFIWNYLYNLCIIWAIWCNLRLICYTCTAMLLHLYRALTPAQAHAWNVIIPLYHPVPSRPSPPSPLPTLSCWLPPTSCVTVQISVKLLKINGSVSRCVKCRQHQTPRKLKNNIFSCHMPRAEWVSGHQYAKWRSIKFLCKITHCGLPLGGMWRWFENFNQFVQISGSHRESLVENAAIIKMIITYQEPY